MSLYLYSFIKVYKQQKWGIILKCLRTFSIEGYTIWNCTVLSLLKRAMLYGSLKLVYTLMNVTNGIEFQLLTYRIRISEILPWDRKSYLTQAILPRLSREAYVHRLHWNSRTWSSSDVIVMFK